MIKTLNITTTEEAALNQVFNTIMAFAIRSPNTAAILDITPLHQERIEQILFRIKQTKATDGRNVYRIPGVLQTKNQSRSPKDQATKSTQACTAP